MSRFVLIGLTLAAALALAAPAHAQLDVNWHTIDGGGGTSSAGVFVLAGTIGQPDAGPGASGMSGGIYSVVGGFWPGIPPACPADFNQSGMVTVADIFAFLTAWFANSPSADFNGVGGVTVADIFAFLTAWFAGCP